MEKYTCDIVKPAEKAIAAFSTSELLDELRLREGVHTSFAAEGASVSINASGPATVIVWREGE